ncbi:MAG: DUF4926 domain-containing protein [Leptolyngbyaceae cyanobacterium CRU_2_3]|nr:DUF4926 domain-containing protein [Leptolyngbyaceae cyanobacterium CRU_2_3]
MKPTPKLLDTVALLKDIPANRLTLLEPAYASVSHLPAGLIGAIVEVYEQRGDRFYQVEFSDAQGCEYAMATLNAEELLVLQSEVAVS